MRALGANATVVLGNHDLHLLALRYGSKRKQKDGDTLDGDPRRARPRPAARMVVRPAAGGVRRAARRFPRARGPGAGVDAARWPPSYAREVEAVLRDDSRTLFDAMYGNKPDKWSDQPARHGPPAFRHQRIHAHALLPRRRHRRSQDERRAGRTARRASIRGSTCPGARARDVRVICGHWSTLGLKRRKDLLALDTGCVWGGALTAVNLDARGGAGAARLCVTSGARRRRLNRAPRADDVAGAAAPSSAGASAPSSALRSATRSRAFQAPPAPRRMPASPPTKCR